VNQILTRLGIPPEVQAFFHAEELIFDYGSDTEHFSLDFHRVPTTPNLYIAGAEAAKELVLTSSVMEGIAFLALSAHHYPNLSDLAVIAIGNLPYQGQLDYISAGWQKRKITLVFGKDILGRLTDIRIATGIRNKKVRLAQLHGMINIEYNHILYRFPLESFSLNKFEKAAALRSGIRTCKPKQFETYLDQLKYDAKQ